MKHFLTYIIASSVVSALKLKILAQLKTRIHHITYAECNRSNSKVKTAELRRSLSFCMMSFAIWYA